MPRLIKKGESVYIDDTWPEILKNKLKDKYRLYNFPKRALSMKEKDIKDMISALENVYPIATRFLDYSKIQYIWEYISSKERAKFVMSGKVKSENPGRSVNKPMPGNMRYDYIYGKPQSPNEVNNDRKK